MEQLTNERGIHGAKHIARLSKRAAALEARFIASPNQVDFDDERAELKSLRWAIDQLRSAELTSPEYISRLRGVMGGVAGANELSIVAKHRRHIEMSPGIGAETQKYALAVCDDIEADMLIALSKPSPVAGEVKG